MKRLSKLQGLCFELEEIESIEPVGYRNCTDISVDGDSSFCLSNGIVSHNSAMGGLSQALGRDGIAYYAGRGVPLNVWKANSAAMNKNKEFTDIMSILGLDPTKAGMPQMCLFDKIVHANDADSDGIHIVEIYMGWWMKLCPELFEKKRICRLMTP